MPRFFLILRLALNSAAQAGLNLVIFLPPCPRQLEQHPSRLFSTFSPSFTREISFASEGIHYR